MGNFWKKYKWYIIAIVAVLIVIGIWQWNNARKKKAEEEASKKTGASGGGTATFTAHPVPPGDTYIFKEGIEGPEVEALQKALNASKKLSTLLVVDGKFGALTKTALKAVTDAETITYANLVKLKEQYK